MVMDATHSQPPSPQSVGREFVRQYYTLLNKAPNHLHRFYNNHSSFIHDESTLFVGQKNIHSRIQQLNFHDCHAKISQVDAQATLGNGVVVQVTGELSNDGQPMRRFTQTFVLAAQSPKKYYVHNDIFRYQDVYSEEENDIEARIESEEERSHGTIQPGQVLTTVAVTNKEQQLIQVAIDQQPLSTQMVDDGPGTANIITQQQSQPVYYSMSADGARPITVLPVPTVAGAVPLGTNFANLTSSVSSQQHQNVQANGVVTHDELMTHAMPQRKTVQAQSSLSNTAHSSTVPQGIPAVSDEIGCAQTSAGTISNNASQVFSQPSTATIGNYQQQSQQQQPQQQQPQQQQQQAPPHLQPHNIQQQIQVQPHPHLQSQQTPPQSQGIPNVVSQQNILYQQQLPIMEANNRTLIEIDDVAATNNVTVQVEPPPPPVNNNVTARGVSSSSDSIQAAPLNESSKPTKEQKQHEKYNTSKQQQQQQQPPQNEPKTYANLFKSSPSPNSFVNAALQQQQQQQTQHHSNKNSFQASSTISSTAFTQSSNTNSSASITTYGARNNNNNNTTNNSNNNANENSTQRQDNNQCYQAPLPQRPSSKSFNRDFDQRRTSNSQFGDNQQLFLGNIPHHAAEDDLKTLFSRFGTVLDLKILSKAPGKLPPGIRNPLNYGFITYEDAESVQNCLAHCPLYFPENSSDRQKLNVEEKKPRSRANDLPARQGMGGGGSTVGGAVNNNVNNNQRNMNNNGPPPSRSLSNSGGGSGGGNTMIRGSGTNNNMSRGGSSGPRMGNTFNRNDNRNSNSGNTGGGGASHMRGGNNNAQATNNNYGVRR